MKTLLWILGAAWLGLAACSRPEAVSTPKPPAVSVAAVAQRPVPVYGQYVGQTEAVKTVEVRARVEGFIDRQAAPDGADVRAGDLLFVIDPRPFEASLRQAQAKPAEAPVAQKRNQSVAALRRKPEEPRRVLRRRALLRLPRRSRPGKPLSRRLRQGNLRPRRRAAARNPRLRKAEARRVEAKRRAPAAAKS